MIAFEDIKDAFSELRDFVLDDLKLITSAPKGGNYAALLLVVTACEAAGNLCYGKPKGGGGERFFKEYLLPDKWRPVSESIYKALRHGLAHLFATKVILEVTDKAIELGISWSKKNHLEYDSGSNTLFINVREISNKLKEAFERYENELRQDAKLRETFNTLRKTQNVYDCRVSDKEKQAWKNLLNI